MDRGTWWATVYGVAKSWTQLRTDAKAETPVLLPGKFHEWRSLVGYSPWGCRESDTTEWLHFLSFYSSFWRRKWQPTPVSLPGESHGQRGLVGYSLWGCKELDTTEWLTPSLFTIYVYVCVYIYIYIHIYGEMITTMKLNEINTSTIS